MDPITLNMFYEELREQSYFENVTNSEIEECQYQCCDNDCMCEMDTISICSYSYEEQEVAPINLIEVQDTLKRKIEELKEKNKKKMEHDEQQTKRRMSELINIELENKKLKQENQILKDKIQSMKNNQ
jgi:FtsZ-binding cell division protein ZapB